MTLVSVFMQGLQMFSDVGIGPSIIQNPRGHDPVFLNTAWTLQVIRGFVLTIVACALAAPFAAFYGHSALTALIWVASTNALLNGFNSTSLATQNRRLALGRLSIIDLASQSVSLAVMIVWVFVSPTVWGLVAGGIMGSITRLVLSHTFLPGTRNGLCWEESARTELLRFGRWIFVSSALTFAAGQADRLVFGSIATLTTLGVYAIALTVAGMPTLIIQRIGSNVLFPVYSRLRHQGQSLRGGLDRARRPLLVTGGITLTALVAAGPSAIHVMYDKRYFEAGWMLQILSLGAWAQCLSFTSGAALMALGHSRAIAAANLVKLVTFVAGVPIAYSLAGFPGAVWATVACETAKYGVLGGSAQRAGLGSLLPDFLVTLQFGASAGLCWLAVRLAEGQGAPPLVVCLIAGMVAGLVWLPSVLNVLHSRPTLLPCSEQSLAS
jgi:O-antigen/teichoic acid export membrane protein